jgi:ferredoxin
MLNGCVLKGKVLARMDIIGYNHENAGAALSTKKYIKEFIMPKLTVDGYGTFEVAKGKRLVLALEEEAGVDQLHACGGNCRCTTCRVEYVAGEPQQITQAEKDKLADMGLTGVRLSCQIQVDTDMHVRAISRLEGSGRADAGSKPDAAIQPPPVWVAKS